jgi:FkbM family methyltransferase
MDAVLTAYARGFEHPCKVRLVRWLARTFAGGRIKMKHASGAVVAVDPEDYVGWAIFRTGSYEPASLRLALKIMAAEPGMFVDVGANFGWYTCAVAPLAGTRVIAVEPDPANCAALRANIERNGLGNVTVFHGAVGPPQQALLAMSRRSPGNCGTVAVVGHAAASTSGVFWAGSTSLQQLLSALAPHARRPVLLKIDVEGFEPQALAGLDFAGPFRPKNILIECDPTFCAAAWGSYDDFAAFFAQRGYDLFDVAGQPFGGGSLPEDNAWARDRNQAQ